MASDFPQLTSAQQNALDYIAQKANSERTQARARFQRVLDAAGADCEIDDLTTTITQRAHLTINFHPDRLLADGRSVIQALFEDGVYRNQFETKISNGGLTAFAGGERDRWEEAMLGSSYHAPGVTDAERPKYGGLNLMNYLDGACPRFGSCHFRLKQSILERTTLTFGDSASDPKDFSVGDALEPLLAGLLEEIAATGNALGRRDVTVPTLVRALIHSGSHTEHGLFLPIQGHVLDHYLEAQIHGPVSLGTDIEALVADPSFRNTAIGALFEAAAHHYDFALEWHAGYELALADVPNDFRGPEMPSMAKRVLETYAKNQGYLDAALIGSAAASVVSSPERWADWGTVKDTLQHLKYLWHVLVVYGKPHTG